MLDKTMAHKSLQLDTIGWKRSVICYHGVLSQNFISQVDIYKMYHIAIKVIWYIQKIKMITRLGP